MVADERQKCDSSADLDCLSSSSSVAARNYGVWMGNGRFDCGGLRQGRAVLGCFAGNEERGRGFGRSQMAMKLNSNGVGSLFSRFDVSP